MNQIKLAIPATGRTSQTFIGRLAELGIVKKCWASKVATALENGRGNLSLEAAKKSMPESIDELALRFDARKGFRAAFLGMEIPIDGIPAIVYGSDWPSISGIREGVGDVAIIGYDDLVASMLPFVGYSGNFRISWEEFNKSIIDPKSTDVRVIGDAGLNDYAAFSLLADNSEQQDWQDLVNAVYHGKRPVFVKGRYQGLADRLLETLLRARIDSRATENIEAELAEGGACALDIVRTGETVRSNNLAVIGEPLFYTMTVIAADITRYNSIPELEKVVDALKPIKGRDTWCNIVQWKKSLEKRLETNMVTAYLQLPEPYYA